MATKKPSFDIYVDNLSYSKYQTSKFGTTITEASRGEVKQTTDFLTKEIGEPHPFNFNILFKWYTDDAFTTGMVDKYVDFIMGGGFFVKSEDETAQLLAEEFMRDHQFDTLLRAWIKEALITGNGFMEISGPKDKVPDFLKVLNSEFIFVKRDKFGVIEGYTQFMGKKETKVDFESFEVAHFAHKQVQDKAYGIGVVFPLTFTLAKKARMIGDMCLIMSRKANAQIHVQIGDNEKELYPTDAQLSTFGEKLEFLNNKHEWVTSSFVNMKILDFGKIGEKFTEPINLLNDELFFGSQVPEVLMGKGSIPEGLATTQMLAFERRISSIQQEIEKVIEEKIFRRLMIAHGLPQVHVEFEWGQPSQEEKNKEIEKLKSLLLPSVLISDELRAEVEQKLAEVLGFEVITPTADERRDERERKQAELQRQQRERDAEEDRRQPLAPGQNRRPPKARFRKKDNEKEHVHENIDEMRDYDLKEWVGFDYSVYNSDIQAWIEGHDYKIEIPDLGIQGEGRLKKTLKTGFNKRMSIKQISQGLITSEAIKDLKIPNQLDSAGRIIKQGRTIPAATRAINISRTETIRATAEGSLANYKRSGVVEEVQWLASLSERTCPICEELNGTIMPLESAEGQIPIHALCRCAWLAVIAPLGSI